VGYISMEEKKKELELQISAQIFNKLIEIELSDEHSQLEGLDRYDCSPEAGGIVYLVEDTAYAAVLASKKLIEYSDKSLDELKSYINRF